MMRRWCIIPLPPSTAARPAPRTRSWWCRGSQRPDRSYIELDWIQRMVDSPARELVQADGRIRRWGQIAGMEGRYLGVILPPDGETVHNAFFDRSFIP